jgi:hypothetical protein
MLASPVWIIESHEYQEIAYSLGGESSVRQEQDMSMRTGVMAGVLVLGLFVAWHHAPAQINEPGQDESLSRLGRRINTFLVSIPKEELDEQFRLLLEGSPLNKDRKKLEQLLESIRRETQRYGSFREVEQVRLELRGQSVARGVYFYKCQDFPLVWEFTFYRSDADDEWALIALRFHVDYEKL